MELNENATRHLDNKETASHMPIALDQLQTHQSNKGINRLNTVKADTVICRTLIRTKRPPVTRQNDFFMVKDFQSSDSNDFANQLLNSVTNLYDFKAL
jgi:hypothetical protein